jgi:sugar/nucleoside kinase (ribokinase family)
LATTRVVVGIGQAGIDHLAIVDRYPEAESNVELGGLSIQGGGTMANTLAALANFGTPTRFLGKLSDDDFGRFIIRGLRNLGVETEATVIEPERISPYRLVVIETETHRRTALHTEGSVGLLEPEELDLTLLDDASLLLVDGHHPAAQVKAAEAARQRGLKVVLDAAKIHEGMGELVALSDVLVASERYASEVAPRGELEDSLIELARMGPRAVVVTLGEEGSIGLEGDKLVRQPPLAVEVVDTTGAGEVFLAGYCYGLLQAWPLERCIQTASAAAGLSCRDYGARGGLPAIDDVLAVA